jgi:uncharacterized protein YwgA
MDANPCGEDEIVTGLAALLRDVESATGVPLNARTFGGRLRIQKTVYLLKALGDPVAAGYSFGEYFYGPYSPVLAKDYYALPEKKPTGARSHIDMDEARHRSLGEAIKVGNDFLEAAATLHSVAARHPRLLPREILGHVRSLKPRLEDELQGAWEFLRKNRLVGEPT